MSQFQYLFFLLTKHVQLSESIVATTCMSDRFTSIPVFISPTTVFLQYNDVTKASPVFIFATSFGGDFRSQPIVTESIIARRQVH